MDISALILVVSNSAFGILFGALIAGWLDRKVKKTGGMFHLFCLSVFIYFIECIAVTVSRGTPFLSIGLAIVWGVIWGMWARGRVAPADVPKAAFAATLYSCIPVMTLAFIPIISWIGGWDILNPEHGARFGIPVFFSLPWPLNTILGFYIIMIAVSLLLKIIVTVGEVFVVYYIKRDFSGNPDGDL